MPAPTPPRETRAALLQTAERIMAYKGFGAVGLNEILAAAEVPKGSFYHHFSSKDAFGEAVVESYIVGYLANMDRIFAAAGVNAAERLMAYFADFRERQSADSFRAGCLIVKLGAEVSDFSEAMRGQLDRGVEEILDRLARVVAAGVADGSVVSADPRQTAEILWDLWIGASVVAKINRDPATFDTTAAVTRRLLAGGS